MIKGTTPSLVFNLPFETSIIKAVEMAIKYVDGIKKVLIVKTLEDCELGERSIGARLTQEETLQFPAPASVLVQLRVKTNDDTILATEPYTVKVKKLLTEDVI